MPRILQLVIFTYWSNIVLPNLGVHSHDFNHQNRVASYSMNVISVYILSMEIPSIMKHQWAYIRPATITNLSCRILIIRRNR